MSFSKANCFVKFISFIILVLAYIECASVWSHYESKDTPYASQYVGVQNKCEYPRISYGNRVYGDLAVCNEIIYKKAKWFSKITAHMNCPSSSQKSSFNITNIVIVDLNTECGCNKKSVELNGGVGKKFVNVTITTSIGCLNHHNVTIFAKRMYS